MSKIPFKNDGSFMEVFKQLQAEQERTSLESQTYCVPEKQASPSVIETPFSKDAILPKVIPPEDQKVVIAIESLIMRLVGMPFSIAKLELAKFEDSVQYWFLTLPETNECKYFQKRLQEEYIKREKPQIKEDVIEASEVDYKLSDIQLPPEKPQALSFVPIKLEAACMAESNKTKSDCTTVPESSIKREESSVRRKRKSRWDTEQLIKQDNDESLNHDDIVASAIAAAKLAAQLAASGGSAVQPTGSIMARQLTGSAALSEVQTKQIQYQKEVTSHLFDILSERTEVKHPMCQDCAHKLIEAQTKLLDFQRNEIVSLETFLAKLTHRGPRTPSRKPPASDPLSSVSSTLESADAASKLMEAREQLLMLQREFSRLQTESRQMDRQIENDTAELRRKQEELDRFTNDYNRERLMLFEAEESLAVLNGRFADALFQYKRLRRTNVLNAAFPIWYDGHVGVINGLHLGRLPTKPVGWPEINGALGQCAMLVTCLAKKLAFTFKNFVIIPMGSQSKIASLPNGSPLPLYNTTGNMRVFKSSNFDNALVMFLDCVGQLQKLVERPPDFCLPYQIVADGFIRDTNGAQLLIRWSGNTDENWSKALKMLLTDLMYITAASIRTDERNCSSSEDAGEDSTNTNPSKTNTDE